MDEVSNQKYPIARLLPHDSGLFQIADKQLAMHQYVQECLFQALLVFQEMLHDQ